MLILLLVGLSLGGVGSAGAAGLNNKLDATQGKLGKVKEQQGVLTKDIEQLSGRMNKLSDAVAVLRSREIAVEAQLEAKQAELDKAVNALDKGRTELRQVRRHLHRALEDLRARLVAIYQSGSPDMTSVILASNGYEDMVQRAEFISMIQAQDENVINRVKSLRDQAQNLVERLKRAKETIQSARDTIAGQKQELVDTRSTLETQRGALASVKARRQTVLDGVSEKVNHLEEIESSISAKIQKQIAATSGLPLLPAGPVGPPSSAGLIWPLQGTLTSPFGYRWGRLHEGIDIAVPEGTPIRAAKAGNVIIAAYTGGYGNYTCIDHGGGLSTCYGHQSSFAVSSGQSVKQGQVIGYSGNTGSSTGPHLHFEVRINGTAVDPMGYL